MPVPASATELLDLAEKSTVLEPEALAEIRAHFLDLPLCSAQQCADRLVAEGVLTKFQAAKLLAGRWRGFVIAGKYKLIDRLGVGGMGAVYLCEHIHMGRRVALKVLPLAQAEDKASLARFYREARAVARLDHPNIVRAHDIDREDKLHFLVLEYVDGCNLHEFVRRNGPLEPGRAASFIRQASLGLQHAHEANLVHRDIKPGNLLLDRQGTVKLLDMGLAQFFGEENSQFVKEYETGFVIGTADFLSPEQTIQSQVDIRADIYSLGCTLYFLLAGKSPFQDGTTGQKMIWHQVRMPKSIRQFRTDVADGLVSVVERMMAKDMALRYQEPADVAQALAEFVPSAVAPPLASEMPQRITGSGRPSSKSPLLQTPQSPGSFPTASAADERKERSSALLSPRDESSL